MASVAWTDTTGSATLIPYMATASGSVARQRFKSWEPTSKPYGDAAHGLGTGIRYLFAFRTDYGATFEVPGIRNTDVDLALRLMEHLLGGGTCSVATGDTNTAVYGMCGLMPETEPELTLSDPPMLEYTLRLSVINVAGSPVPMLCEY